MAVEYTIRKLRREDDTTRVVKLHFTACVTYGQFVQLINIMKLETQPIYAYSGDDLYAWEVADRW